MINGLARIQATTGNQMMQTENPAEWNLVEKNNFSSVEVLEILKISRCPDHSIRRIFGSWPVLDQVLVITKNWKIYCCLEQRYFKAA